MHFGSKGERRRPDDLHRAKRRKRGEMIPLGEKT